MSADQSDRRWKLRAPSSVPTMTVYERSPDAVAADQEKVKQDARVIPFGFSAPAEPAAKLDPQLLRPDVQDALFGAYLAMAPAVERKPLTWEGED